MTTRRDFLLTGTGALAETSMLYGCSGGDVSGYAEVVRSTFRHTESPPGDPSELQRDLVRYATLVPSSHNSQCWNFRLGDDRISILADPSRRCPVVDPNDHHLYVSLGCAAENLAQAARAGGFHPDIGFDARTDAVHVMLTQASPVRTPLFEAIPRRQSTRAEYDGKAVSSEHLRLLERAGQGDGVEVLVITAGERLEQILDYVTRGNDSQMGDPAFLAELKAWIRFNESEALATRDGLFAAASGNPTVPRWVGARLMPLFFTAASENDRNAKQVPVPRASRYSSQKRLTRPIGSRRVDATSALPSRRPEPAQCHGESSRRSAGAASVVRFVSQHRGRDDPTWWFDSAMGRRRPVRCAGRSSKSLSDPAKGISSCQEEWLDFALSPAH